MGESFPACRAARSLGLVLSLALGVAVWPVPAVAQSSQSAAQSREYQIAAGPLGPALNRFGHEAGILLSYPSELVTSRRTRGLEGRYQVGDGLRALLMGTGLGAVRHDDGGYTLREITTSELAPISVTASAAGATGAQSYTNSAAVPDYQGGQVAAGGRLGVLGNLHVMDAPFQVAGYTERTIREQQARSVADVLVNNDASVRVVGGRADLVDTYVVRGFPISNQDISLDGLYGLLPYWRVPIEFAERVELLKGPNALLNGMPPGGSVGGTINVVPKRAGDEPLTRLTLDHTSDAQVGTHLDLGRRFGADRRFGVRFNGVYRKGDTAVDGQQREFPLASLALDYRGERLRASLDLLFQKESLEGVMRPLIPSGSAPVVPDAPDSDRLFGMSNSYMDQKDQSSVARAEYDLSDSLTAFGSFGLRRSRYDTVAANASLLNADGDLALNPARQRGDWRSWTSEAGLRGRFATGAVNHEWTFSGSHYRIHEAFAFGRYSGLTGNLYQPAVYIPADTSDLDGHLPTSGERQLTGAALTDRLLMLDDRLQITLGARRQRVETLVYDKRVWTPLVGVAVEPLPSLTLYANAVQGLSQGDTAPPTASNAGDTLEPYKTRQYEIGVKYDQGSFLTSLSAFQIKKASAITDSSNVFRADGEQRNRGLEFEVHGELGPGLRVLSGLSYIQPLLTRSEDPDNEGNDAQGVSREQVNLGLSWDTPFQPGLTLDGRWIYSGSAYLDAENDIEAPSWQRVDLGARYRLPGGGKPVTVGANLENLFGEDYWMAANNYVTLGAPRTLTLFLTMDF